MNHQFDPEKTIEVIKRMQLAKIGEYQKWESLVKKINQGNELSPAELTYFSNFTRIYKKLKPAVRSKIYHTKLSHLDEKPPCKTCGEQSQYYCNMNDEYFCIIHVVGHDMNEL